MRQHADHRNHGEHVKASGWHNSRHTSKHHSFYLLHSFIRLCKTASSEHRFSCDSKQSSCKQAAHSVSTRATASSHHVSKQRSPSLVVQQQAVTVKASSALRLYSCDSKRLPYKQTAPLLYHETASGRRLVMQASITPSVYSCDSKRYSLTHYCTGTSGMLSSGGCARGLSSFNTRECPHRVLPQHLGDAAALGQAAAAGARGARGGAVHLQQRRVVSS